MTTWNVKRVWRVDIDADGATTTKQLSTVDLARFRCVVMLGAAGAGKTTEARVLAGHEGTVRECRLAEYADTSSELAEHLTRLARGADAATRFHLDALDEAMIPARRRWLAVKRWIEQDLRETGASIRITCRTAVWPTELSNAIRGFCGPESFATAYLQPLTEADVDAAAESTGIDPNAFRANIEKARARSLALHPLTLRMLLELSRDGHGLPSTLKDLFDKGVRMLARDGQDRREIETQIPLPPDQIADVAERLACYTVLTGRETVNLGDDVAASQLGLQDLSGRVAEDELRAVGSSGLCDSSEPETFRFAHRQFAEYLAGRRLAGLPIHQSRAFLAGPDGWRSGVAGPLRETAAFAAMFDTDLAAWLSSRDPEVVGLSDVADDALRRQATLDLLGRFRSGTLAAGELHRGDMELHGFQYEGAETDLRPVLQERGDRCEHVLACAISLIRSWRLSPMSDALGDLALDSTAPLHARTSAGHALLECGDAAARERLKPLLAGLPEDEQDELKGIALQCNWPDRLSAPELFDALTPRRRRSFFGAYASFLYKLDVDGLPLSGHVAAGLRWAKTLASGPNDTDSLHRLCMRIAHAALRELDDPEIAAGLMSLMRHWMKRWKSPLALSRKDPLDPSSSTSLYADRQVRRRLIDLLTEFVVSTEELRNLAFETPGLLHEEDFQWLLRRGCDDGRVVDVRERYLEIAKFLPWRSRRGDVDAWLRVCDADPVKRILGNQSIALDSEQATRLREDWKRLQDRKQRSEPPPLDPPPRDRVLKVLALSETKDVGYFPNLCRELTLEPRSTHYGFGRFLTDMPGWRGAALDTRTRIVEVAKRYLSVETIAETLSSKLSPNTTQVGGLDAMWLVLDRDPDWLKSRSEFWWNGWCRYILAESILNMAGESADPKLRLVELLNDGAPASVCREVLHLLSSKGIDDRHQRFSDALRLLADQANTRLDEKLCEALEGGEVQEEDIVDVAEFVLRRAKGRSLPMCLRILENARTRPEGSQAEHVAVALLRNCPDASWTVLKTYLDADADRARRVLEAFAYDDHHGPRIIGSVSTRQLGELAGMLLDLFPPDEDEDEDEGKLVGPVDAARLLRMLMISHLADLRDEQSVDAFRRLEQRLGNRYPWLAGARIHAERAYRLTRWSPFLVDVIADVMDAETRRLLRSDEDVVDGIECALEQYAEALRRDGMESVEDLWNTVTGVTPSPKAEEHVSRKLCGVVKSYFRDYAVTADREVEIYRSVSRSEGGQPGSKVDILVQAPGRGTTSGDAIRVPIEVKMSSNPQAKTGMKDQLVDRYMPQLGATHGVYVVVWMTTPNPERLQPHHRPRWSCIEEARRELEEEARRLSEEPRVRVRAVVVDGSLR